MEEQLAEAHQQRGLPGCAVCLLGTKRRHRTLALGPVLTVPLMLPVTLARKHRQLQKAKSLHAVSR